MYFLQLIFSVTGGSFDQLITYIKNKERGDKMLQYIIILSIIAVSLIYIAYNFYKVKSLGEGTEKMRNMAKIIRDGANEFMKTEFRRIILVVAIVAVVVVTVIEPTCGITFVMGACMSSAACIIGMRVATYANVRTTEVARKGNIGDTIKVALRGGSVCGLSVHAFGLLGFILIFMIFGTVDPHATGSGLIKSLICNPTTQRLMTYSLGCSLVAMFNRVAGGNFTKAADISSDIVGKNKMDLPEDDQKNPSTAADQVGDNVNDVAGNESDLLESTVATLGSSVVIANLVFHMNGADNLAMLNATISFPLILSASGLLACLIALVYAFLHKSKGNPGKELDMVLTLSAVLTMAAGVGASYFLFGTGNVALYEDFKLGWLSPAVAAGLGVLAGIAIGKITEFYTSGEFKHVKELADMSKEGTAFVVTLGDALGSRSCLIPMILIAISVVISNAICGMYGIAVAALGMLSFVASTVSVDAFGPIADNAGGIAEASGLPEEVREITDELDATGNTTAAIGKGFAIGSAAFATSSLIVGYVGSYQSGEPTLNAVSPLVLAGLIIGAALVEFFCGMLSKNTIKAAQAMADESLKQLEDERIMNGEILPDYNKCIKLATYEALHHMVAPSVLALAVPAVVGIVAGPEVVGGMILGATVVAIPRAIFMGNSGGAFDNAKKLVEQGRVKYADGTVVKKGSPEHKCAVDGDTVGDTRKDVVGVDLDIFIKMMSTVANIMAPIFKTIHLFG